MFHPRKIFISRLLLTDFRKHALLAIPEIDYHTCERYWNRPSSEELERSVGRRRKDRLFAVCSAVDAHTYLWGCADMRAWLRVYSQLTATELLRPYSTPSTLTEVIDQSFRRLEWILRGYELTYLGDYVPPG